jgi:hypothetical protein
VSLADEESEQTEGAGASHGRTPFGQLRPLRSVYRRLDAAARLSGPARYAAYATLDADLAGKAAPMIAFGVQLTQDFFSARIGCQVFQPTYGIDLAALCIKHD